MNRYLSRMFCKYTVNYLAKFNNNTCCSIAALELVLCRDGDSGEPQRDAVGILAVTVDDLLCQEEILRKANNQRYIRRRCS